MSTSSKSRVYRSFVSLQSHPKIITPLYNGHEEDSVSSPQYHLQFSQYMTNPQQKQLKSDTILHRGQPKLVSKQLSESKLSEKEVLTTQINVPNFDIKKLSSDIQILNTQKQSAICYIKPQEYQPRFKVIPVQSFKNDCLIFTNKKNEGKINTIPNENKLVPEKKLNQSQTDCTSKQLPSPFTSKAQQAKLSSNLNLSQTKTIFSFQTSNPVDETKSITDTEHINQTSVVNDLSKQLNQKQSRISELQNKNMKLTNSLNDCKVQYERELKQKERQKAELVKINNKLQLQIKEIKMQIISYGNQLKQKQKQQLVFLKAEEKLQQKIEELTKNQVFLNQQIKTIKEEKLNIENQNILTEIRNELEQKQKRNLELQHYNELLLIQLQEIKQEMNFTCAKPAYYSFNQTSHLNNFQQSLKGYLQEIERYKIKIQQKQKQIQALKGNYNILRIQNQHLKNQLRIEEFRRLTELRNNDTLMGIQRQSLMNQLKDVRHQLSISKQKTKSLSSEIRNKDEFIMKNLKIQK